MSISRLLVAVALSLATCATAVAKEELPPVKVHHEAGIDYAYGGMDPLDRKALGKMAERFLVQLAFSREGTNEKLSGVKVTLIVQLACGGRLVPQVLVWAKSPGFDPRRPKPTLKV